ncbi:T9SS type B sorting domain-containing protein [Pareuzebyella sediminis]|uniref:T9SS type B sorting domain-containing protein n=1 Tax=Pareuzebyella sediminis TaxID=2607998 RepID=UPI001E3B0186|nr:gliding motility-associated C-terminal domain-containing protein [Pareuzebyella sediminis]
MRTKFNTSHLFFMALLFMAVTELSAQAVAINAPKPANNPNITCNSGNCQWNRICAGNNGGFNQYYATVDWAGSPNSGNEWILELSDSNGDFTNAVELARESSNSVVQDPGFEFSIPIDTQGDGYKLRVRSTNPASTGQASPAYSMYYLGYTSNLHISPDGDGTTPGTLQACGGNSITLSVDNVPSADLNTYQYSWFRSGTQLPETGPSIETDGSGEYFVYIDYGDCTFNANTESNHIIINTGTSSGIAINSPTSTSLCAGDPAPPLEANVQDANYIYTWFKDGVTVQPAQIGGFSYTIDTNNPDFIGDYTVEIKGTGLCTERSEPVTISNSGAFTVSRDNGANIVVLPGQTQALTVTTDASVPTYEWFLNGAAIPSSNSAVLNITQPGTYYAAVTQTGGACSSTTINSEPTEVVTPTAFRLEIDYGTSYESCANSSIVLEIDKIYAVLADMSELDVTADTSSSFTFQWKKDGTIVSAETSPSISLTASTENGTYELDGALGGLTTTSNTLPVQLSSSETLTINSSSTVYCSTSDVITINTAADLNGETFAWQRNGSSINTSDPQINATEPGTYRLVILRGDCPVLSNEIDIQPLNPDLIALDVTGDVVFPEGSSKTVTASGGTSYRWLNADNIEISSSASVTFSEEGSYLLIANIDNCEISRPITVSYLDLFNIPNVITPNADGANDQWVIPNSYSNKSDVNVVIYNAKGVEVLNATNYQNNWPESSMVFPKQNMVFYYVIKNATETLKQGTITVIR